MFTWSENPSQDMWNHIGFFGKGINCKNLLNGEIESGRTVLYDDGPELERKANQVSMCINQSREYFFAAQQVSINTSPLLYFYGMLSLAKALIVSNIPNLYLEDIKYHGLNTRPVYEYLKLYQEDHAGWSMEKEFAVTRGGVFKHLTEIFNGSSFEDNSIIEFKDVLSICPEISMFFEKYYKENSKVMYLYSVESHTDPSYKLELLPREVDENKIYERFPELKDDFELAPEIIHTQARKFTSKNLTTFPDYFGIYSSFIGGQYIVGGIDYYQGSDRRKKYIHQVTADYLAMFILSDCVRYKQNFWGSIVQGQQSGVLGLIEIYTSIVKRRYPNFILNCLYGEDFRYGSPSYFS